MSKAKTSLILWMILVIAIVVFMLAYIIIRATENPNAQISETISLIWRMFIK